LRSSGLRPTRTGSEPVESTSIRRKSSPFAGRRRKRIFGPFIVLIVRLQSYQHVNRRPGCSTRIRVGALTNFVSPQLESCRPVRWLLRYEAQASSPSNHARLVGHRVRACCHNAFAQGDRRASLGDEIPSAPYGVARGRREAMLPSRETSQGAAALELTDGD